MRTVYIVDDNAAHAKIAEKVVKTASNGQEVKTRVFHRPILALTESEAGEKPDLLVIDFMMPGMDGVQLIRELRKRGITAPAIMVSAYGATIKKVIVPGNGITGVFSKPFDLKALSEAIHDALVEVGEPA